MNKTGASIDVDRDIESKVLHGIDAVGNKIVSNLSSYLEFIALYKKERTIKAQRIVSKIVETEDSIVSRIKKIDQLDMELEENGADKGKHLVKELVPISKGIEKLVQRTFLNYIFFGRQRLVKFGLRTGTISFVFFGLKKRKSDDALLLWESYHSDIKQFLLKEMYYVVLNGWIELGPLEYNIVVLFYKFLSVFDRIGGLIKKGNSYYRNAKIIDLFIIPYLSVVHRSSYREALKANIFKILSNHPKYSKSISHTLSVIENIINIDKRSLSFCNVILASYALYYNRFLKFYDLVSHYNIQDIREDGFDFNTNLMDKINKLIEDINISIQKMEDDLFILQYIEEGLAGADAEEGENKQSWIGTYNKLVNYEYNIKHKSNRIGKASVYSKNPFKIVYNNVLEGLIQVSKGFLAYYGDILQGQINIGTDKDYNSVSVFHHTFFMNELGELAGLVAKHATFDQVTSINIDKYYLYIDSRALDNEAEERRCGIIERTITLYKNIAYKLCQSIIISRNMDSVSTEELLAGYKKREDAIDEKAGTEKMRFIPYASETIFQHPFLTDKSINDVVYDIVLFSINLIYFFKEGDINRRYDTKGDIIAKIEYYLNIKSKLA